jgi:ADAM-TS Spacer 1
VRVVADYVEMFVIPKGARNIRVEELENASNYIAIQSEATKEFYLNGQWCVATSHYFSL